VTYLKCFHYEQRSEAGVTIYRRYTINDIYAQAEQGCKRDVEVRDRDETETFLKGCLHYDTCTPYMYVVQVYGVHVS